MAEVSADQGAPRRSFWQRVKEWDDRLNDCWIGDLFGAVLIFLIMGSVPVALPILIIICGGNP